MLADITVNVSSVVWSSCDVYERPTLVVHVGLSRGEAEKMELVVQDWNVWIGWCRVWVVLHSLNMLCWVCSRVGWYVVNLQGVSGLSCSHCAVSWLHAVAVLTAT